MERSFAAFFIIITGSSCLVSVAIAENQACPTTLNHQTTARRVNCKTSSDWPGKEFDATLTAWGDELINVSFTWPLINCRIFKQKGYNATLQIYRGNEVYLTKSYILDTNRSRPKSSGTKEKFQIKAIPGEYHLHLTLPNAKSDADEWWLYSGVTIDGANIAKNLSFAHHVSQTFTIGLDNKVPARYNGTIEPKLDGSAKVFITMANSSEHTIKCICDENLIDWDMFEEAPAGEIDHDRVSIKKKCTMTQKRGKSFIACDFGRVSVETSGAYFKVIVVGDSWCKNGTKRDQNYCCSMFPYELKNITSARTNETLKKDDQSVLLMNTVSTVVVVVAIIASKAIIVILIKNKSLIVKALIRKYETEPKALKQPIMDTNDGSKLDLIILLIYSNTTDDFMDSVGELKYHLSSFFPASEVIDIFDEDYEQEMNTHGLQFITKFTREGGANPKIKIILIHSNETARLLQTCKEDTMEWDEREKPAKVVNVDLTENPFQLKYNKVYNVCFEKFPLANASQMLKFNKLTNYYFPKHAKDLCRDLSKTDVIINA